MIRALAIACLVLLLTTITFGVLWHMRGLTIATYQQVASTNAGTIKTLGSANDDQSRTIATLLAKLKTMAGQKQAVEAKAAQAQLAADINAKARDRAVADAETLRRKLYASDIDARNWSTGRVPASISEQLHAEYEAARGDP